MMSKPVAVVLLLAAVVIAAFVGGYVYQIFAPATVADDALVLVDPDPVTAGGSAATGSGGAGTARAKPNRGTAQSRPGGSGTDQGGATSGASVGAGSTGSGAASTAGAGTGATDSVRPKERVPVDLVVPAGEVITLQLITPLSSETAKVEDRVEAMIGEPIMVDQTVAVPKGTKVLGSVTTAVKGGKVKEPAQVGVRFHTLVLGPDPGIDLVIEPIVQLGVAPSGRSKATIGGGAAIGAGLGWLLGGTEGAIKGGITGAGGGTAATMMTKAQPAIVPAGARAPVRLGAPFTVRVERE